MYFSFLQEDMAGVESVIMAPPAGNGSLEIVFSFDTTGSMCKCIDEVRDRLQDMIRRLASDIPMLRIGVIAHGDYCDAEHFYVSKQVDLTTDGQALCDFVRDVSGTGGGDFEECYELALRKARTEMSWSAGTQRSLVVIGDAIPHEVDYDLNTDNIDWRQETDQLSELVS